MGKKKVRCRGTYSIAFVLTKEVSGEIWGSERGDQQGFRLKGNEEGHGEIHDLIYSRGTIKGN